MVFHDKSVNPVTFLIMDKHISLDVNDKIFDKYREFLILGGRIYYQELEKDFIIIREEELISHFASTIDVCLSIRTPHHHVLPLNKVNDSNFDALKFLSN